MNRRNFFEITAGTALAAALESKAHARPVPAPLSASTQSPTDPATDEDYWSQIRNEFTTDRTVINLNNGHVSPAPRTVQEAMRRYLDYSNMGPFHTMILELEPKIEAARRSVAESAGVDPEEIAITRNSSESLEIAQLGIDLKPGDEVLTTNQDYPRMLTTFRQRELRDGIKLKTISFPVPAISMDDLYNRYEQAVTPQTKLILVCHITNRTGQIFPIRRICDMAHAKGIPVIVDGAHSFNQFPFKISDLNCDYYGVSLHKWTFAPIGTGFLYVNKSRIKETWAMMAADKRQDNDIRKFEEIGTHPAANHDAICEAITFNNNIGIERKAARLRYLKDRWANQLAENPEVKILHNPSPEMSCGIGMFGLKNADPHKLTRALADKYKIYVALAPHPEYVGIRVTPSVYTAVDEIDIFVRAVNHELKSA
ncbi:MAG TPA: aminotransferase class V-fold PLP-dependent enzyme [Bryobacteraceae bacterium]|nr:aminotransferase class V-fold PLP-dependent enzyme [Bryobacteraceae bacterium]